MKLIATYDPVLFLGVTDCLVSPAPVAAVVLKSAEGRLGFELDPTILECVCTGNAVGMVRENNPQWAQSGDSWSQSFIFPNSSRGVVVVESPDPEVLLNLHASDINIKRRKSNTILARHQRPAQPLEPCTFDAWTLPDRRLACAALMWLLQHARIVGIWRRTDWGLHWVAFSSEHELLRDRLAQFSSLCDVKLEEVDAIASMPAW